MKDAILLELANKLERDAKEPEVEDGSESAQIGNAMAKARREAQREFADIIRGLVKLLGDDHDARLCKTASRDRG